MTKLDAIFIGVIAVVVIGCIGGILLFDRSDADDHRVYTCYKGPERGREVTTTIPTANGGAVVLHWRSGLKECK